jgi:hypothetical protein
LADRLRTAEFYPKPSLNGRRRRPGRGGACKHERGRAGQDDDDLPRLPRRLYRGTPRRSRQTHPAQPRCWRHAFQLELKPELGSPLKASCTFSTQNHPPMATMPLIVHTVLHETPLGATVTYRVPRPRVCHERRAQRHGYPRRRPIGDRRQVSGWRGRPRHLQRCRKRISNPGRNCRSPTDRPERRRASIAGPSRCKRSWSLHLRTPRIRAR